MVPVVIDGWSSLLADKEDEKMLATIRLHTRTGRPAGSKEFVAALETRLRQRLQPRSAGRPGKNNANDS
jgi:putative transposase